jgi:hypothetical protein
MHYPLKNSLVGEGTAAQEAMMDTPLAQKNWRAMVVEGPE